MGPFSMFVEYTMKTTGENRFARPILLRCKTEREASDAASAVADFLFQGAGIRRAHQDHRQRRYGKARGRNPSSGVAMNGFGAVVVLVASLVTSAARADTDVLLRAVGFALTGSDSSKVAVISRSECIFRVDGATYRLNNVETDRLYIRPWTDKLTGAQYLRVTLHGDAPVYEADIEPMFDEKDPVFKSLLKTRPELFAPRRIVENEWTTGLNTTEKDRVVRAWRYIYSHGCLGKRSPF